MKRLTFQALALRQSDRRRANARNVSLLTLYGGQFTFRIDRQNKRGGGVCACVRQTFKSEVLNEISGISDNRLHQLWVKIQVRNLKLFLVCTTHRPPRTPTTSLDLGASLICASLLKKPIYLLRDMNCNLLKPDLIDSHAFANFCYTYN